MKSFDINNIKEKNVQKCIKIAHRIQENIWRTTTLQMRSSSRMYFLCEGKREKKKIKNTSRLNSLRF